MQDTSHTPLKTPRLSVVAPCYNEQDSLGELHQRVSVASRDVVGNDYEFVLVNDGSRDETWSMLVALSRDDPHVVAVNLSRNHGHQLALSAGLSVCRGERILVIDADLQDPPELLGAMMEKMDEGCDVVYGQRTTREGETRFKRFAATVFYRLLQRLVDIDIALDTGDFRLMSRRALDILLAMPAQFRFIRGMVSWIGFRQEPLPYHRAARFAGETKYPLPKMILFALDAITGFSIRPLRVASYLGAVTEGCGLVALVYVLWRWAVDDVVQGWTSLMVVVLLMGGAQIFLLGVMGEYLGRMYIESKRRPLFLIDKIVRDGTPNDVAPPPLDSSEIDKV